MKKGIMIWLIFFLIFVALAYLMKVMAVKMAKKVMVAKQWPLPELSDQWAIPIGYITKPVFGEEAIKVAKSYVIMSDIFIWSVVWAFIIFGLFLWEN